MMKHDKRRVKDNKNDDDSQTKQTASDVRRRRRAFRDMQMPLRKAVTDHRCYSRCTQQRKFSFPRVFKGRVAEKSFLWSEATKEK